jgi:hypothetical protein
MILEDKLTDPEHPLVYAVHFRPGIDERLDWISLCMEENFQDLNSFNLYWVLTEALENYIKDFRVNRRRTWHWRMNQTGTRRFFDTLVDRI